MTMKTMLSIASVMVIGIQTAHANNVVVDMSQVQDYNQYQMDLQQCEGLAVQNQPDAPQRESVAGTADKGAALGAPRGSGRGGTGSFISSSGLIITNHHVALDAVRQASTTEHDYLNDGFVAQCREGARQLDLLSQAQ